MSADQTCTVWFSDIELGTITMSLLAGRLHTIKDTQPAQILLESQRMSIAAAWTPYRPGSKWGQGSTIAEAVGDFVVRNKLVEIEDTELMDSRWSVCKSNFVE